MKKFTTLLLLLLVIAGSTFFGKSILNVMADEASSSLLNRYYKSVEIREGDSLWSIAKTYQENGNLTTKEYVDELKNMNSLKQDTIHAGQYLTVVYFSTEMK